MIYLQKNNKKGNKNKKALIVALVIVLFLAAAGIIMAKIPDLIGAGARSLGLPLWRAKADISESADSFSNSFRTRRAILEENESLKKELDEIRARLINFDTLNGEYARLLADFGREVGQSRTLASVLVRPPQSPYDTVILDIGSRDGVREGDGVFGSGGVALGKISEISGNTAKAVLFSRAGSKTTALIARNNLSVVLVGRGGGGFEIDAPQDADITENDVLVMPFLETAIVGFVLEIESNVKSAFKRVLVQSPVNISELRFVLVGALAAEQTIPNE